MANSKNSSSGNGNGLAISGRLVAQCLVLAIVGILTWAVVSVNELQVEHSKLDTRVSEFHKRYYIDNQRHQFRHDQLNRKVDDLWNRR